MKKGDIVKVKEGEPPLYLKGDKFKILRINENPDLMPIVAMRFKDKELYGFEEDELENDS